MRKNPKKTLDKYREIDYYIQALFECRRKFGPVAQLVRAPACHAGGRRFEPVLGRHFFALIAQLVEQQTENLSVDGSIPPQGTTNAGVAQLAEQLICNQQVVGSSPITGSTTLKQATLTYGQIPERPNGSDCKSDVFDFGGSNPPLPTKMSFYAKIGA